MKKVGIVTIIDKNNYGNRLQNYALSYYCNKKYNCDMTTLLNENFSNERNMFFFRMLKNFFRRNIVNNYDRQKRFIEFDKNIKFSDKKINCFSKLKKYDYLIVGSDQVWNPLFRRLRDVDVLKNIDGNKRISYAASFGIKEIPKKYNKKIEKEIGKFKAISVREDRGKEIIEKLTGRSDIEVLVDPTMLLTDKEWDKVSKKPKMLNSEKFILNYFLGELSEERKKEIEKVAKENNCEIINILDKNSPFYECGPSEFLYLEKNAFLICTDSFHSSVFAILYNRPFVIFDREQKGVASMNSRLETLISKFNLKNRKYNGNYITKENMQHDYTEAYKILEKERKKSESFLKKALNIKDSD